ncbi:hypothetical protein FB45DRAFT_38676 [Roridomyces roridus]|uniref:F-box domain-containing protein n=1 Tax=Roridomyces roridus TaxID=1738132 RepID=A0AAD7FJX0_9AGAR|nr:hypothetical protein FB45DRAFT_38676 [Roridomyces roridus]
MDVRGGIIIPFLSNSAHDSAQIQNSIPPILRLPNELLAEIAAARLDEAARHNGFREVFLEFGLSHVCQRFRQTLLGTSAFWTTFTVNVYREGSVNLSRLYLERSATRDIRLSLAALDGVGASSLVHLIPHASRISRLFVAYVSPQALSEVLAPFEGVALPRLEHVKFSNDGGWNAPQISSHSTVPTSPL